MRENQLVAYSFDSETGIITVNVRGQSPLTLDWKAVHPKVKEHYAIQGVVQGRIADAGAKNRKGADGRPIPMPKFLMMKWEAIKKVIEHYATGTPEVDLPKGARESAGYALQLMAFAEQLGVSEEKASERLSAAASKKGVDVKAYLAYLCEGEILGKRIIEIRARRAGGKADADEKLKELMDFKEWTGAKDEE